MVKSRHRVIIVGAGTAGCVLASRLSEDPDLDILLLESGLDFPIPEQMPEQLRWGALIYSEGLPRDYMWNFRAMASPTGPPIWLPRGKAVGGSSAVNAQIFLRALPRDFDEWGPGWTHAELCPAYDRIELHTRDTIEARPPAGRVVIERVAKHHWPAEQTAFMDSCVASGARPVLDLNAEPIDGVGPIALSRRGRVRWSAALAYLDAEVRSRPNLEVVAETSVRRVRFDGPRACGVELVDGSSVEADQVVLAAGVIGSPLILSRSGIGPSTSGAARLRELRGVGRNLSDHPQVVMRWTARQAHDHAQGGTYCGWRTSSGQGETSDLFVHPFTLASSRAGATDFVHLVVALYRAQSRGWLDFTATGGLSEGGLQLNYLATSSDRARMRVAIRRCAELARSGPLARVCGPLRDPPPRLLDDDDALDQWIAAAVTTSHHACGTCKLGPASEPDAVVDAWGRVHGLASLRVADASIMPQCPSANTNATAYLIGERMAEFIRAELHH